MAPIDSSALELLRQALSPSASVNLPGDPGYSVKRWAQNAEKPAAVVACPATPEDVVQILAFAQGKAPYDAQQRLHLAVKGGGHTPSGASSSDGGVVIDLQPQMHNVRVDPEAKLAYVGGGALWEHVDEATFKHGLASVAGIVSHTGVGGLTLNGGYGWLCSQHGLVIDNLQQVTIVTSAGEILKASNSENTDLFWAVRGGGGNFGVVTEFVLKVHDQRPDMYLSTLIYSPDAIEKVITEVNAWFTERTVNENAHIACAMGPNGQPVFVLQLTYNGDSETGAKKYERFVKLEPMVNNSETMSYLKLNHLKDPMSEHGIGRSLQGNFIPCVPGGIPPTLIRDLYNAWLKMVTEYPEAARSIVAAELYNNEKWSSVPPDATAFVHRKPVYNLAYVTTWTDPAFSEKAHNAIVTLNTEYVRARNAHFPSEAGHQGGFTNYMDEENRLVTKDFANRRFGNNFPRLVEIKRKYDPGNMFGKWLAQASSPDARH